MWFPMRSRRFWRATAIERGQLVFAKPAQRTPIATPHNMMPLDFQAEAPFSIDLRSAQTIVFI